MGIFKSKEEKQKIKEEADAKKALEEIKKKQKQIEEFEKKETEFYDKILKEKQKIKEEMKTMAKLAIKDGKLQPVSEEEVKKILADVPEPTGSPFGGDYRQQQQQQQRMDAMRRAHLQPLPTLNPQPIPPPQEFEEQPTPPETQTGKYVVTIVLTDKSAISVEVEQAHINNFLENISEAIRDQAPFQIGNKVLNGRYIMFFTL